MNPYTFYSDPGHGWLAVPRQEVEDLGIAGHITEFSYEQGDTLYLEEDCDAPRFLDAYAKAHGGPPPIKEEHVDVSSPIRRYVRYGETAHH